MIFRALLYSFSKGYGHTPKNLGNDKRFGVELPAALPASDTNVFDWANWYYPHFLIRRGLIMSTEESTKSRL
jgi:hypothetical protein